MFEHILKLCSFFVIWFFRYYFNLGNAINVVFGKLGDRPMWERESDQITGGRDKL